MDVYLSPAAIQGLSALALEQPLRNPDGILLGHQRGPRLFVESVFPSRQGFFSSTEAYFRLDRHFDNRIMGFYSFQADEDKIQAVLVPCVFGKVFLDVRIDKQGRLRFVSFLVDFDGAFRLQKIPLKKNIRKGSR